MTEQNPSFPTLFADTSRISEIKRMRAYKIVTGITTNPGIVANDSKNSSGIDPMEGYRQIAKEFPGTPFSIQLLNESESELIDRGKLFASISPDVVIKVPMFGDGRESIVIDKLLREQIKVNVTALMSADQALVALLHYPTYVSLFFNRIKDYGTDPAREITRARELIEKYDFPSRIIVGSIRRPQDVTDAVVAGAHIVTVTPKVFWAMVDHPKTEEFIDENQRAWAQVTASIVST